MKNKFYQKIILVFSLFVLLFSATPAMAINCICYENLLQVGTYENAEKCLSEHPTLPGAHPTYCVKVDTTPTTSPIIQDVQKAAAAKEATTQKKEIITKDIQFTPQIGIPGSEFEQGVGVAIGGTVTKNGSKTLVANLISRYVNSLYSWGLSVVGIFAVLMLMAGGILWITSGGDTARIESAKKMITNSFLGSILLLGAWFLLNTINPNLVKPANLEITTIDNSAVEYSSFQNSAEKFKFVCLSGSLTCANTVPPSMNIEIETCYNTYGHGVHGCVYPEKAWCCGVNADTQEKADQFCVGKTNGTACRINETAALGSGYCLNDSCKQCTYFGLGCTESYECLSGSLLICGYGEAAGIEYRSNCNSGYCAGVTKTEEMDACGPNFEGRCYDYVGIYTCPGDTKAYPGGTECASGLKCCIRKTTGVTGTW